VYIIISHQLCFHGCLRGERVLASFIVVFFLHLFCRRTSGAKWLSHTINRVKDTGPQSGTRHTASTSTRWHFAFGLCCHSNETSAPIANPPNSAQLEGTPTVPPSYICAVVWQWWEGQTADTQTAVMIIHFASSATHAKCNNHSLQW